MSTAFELIGRDLERAQSELERKIEEIAKLEAQLSQAALSRQLLIADFAEYLYRTASQVPFEHATWARERGQALLNALKK